LFDLWRGGEEKGEDLVVDWIWSAKKAAICLRYYWSVLSDSSALLLAHLGNSGGETGTWKVFAPVNLFLLDFLCGRFL
jgi:hypothetical protein